MKSGGVRWILCKIQIENNPPISKKNSPNKNTYKISKEQENLVTD